MGMTDIRKPGQRQDIADGGRWRRDPEPEAHREAEARSGPDVAESLGRLRREPADDRAPAAGNVDTSLRERIRRLSAARAEALRERDLPEPPEAPRAAAAPRPRETAAFDAERESGEFSPRQPARRRRPEPEAEREYRPPVRRRNTAPETPATQIDPIEDEMEELSQEVARLRQEVAQLRGEIAKRPAGGGEIGPVERALQKLAERMDRIDGGPRPPIADGRPAGRPRRGFLGLFGRN